MLEEPEKVAAVIDEAAMKSLQTTVSEKEGEEDAVLHEWFRFVLETSVRLALAILPAAPLLGQKLPTIADDKGFSASRPSAVRFEKLTF